MHRFLVAFVFSRHVFGHRILSDAIRHSKPSTLDERQERLTISPSPSRFLVSSTLKNHSVCRACFCSLDASLGPILVRRLL